METLNNFLKDIKTSSEDEFRRRVKEDTPLLVKSLNEVKDLKSISDVELKTPMTDFTAEKNKN